MGIDPLPDDLNNGQTMDNDVNHRVLGYARFLVLARVRVWTGI